MYIGYVLRQMYPFLEGGLTLYRELGMNLQSKKQLVLKYTFAVYEYILECLVYCLPVLPVV